MLNTIMQWSGLKNCTGSDKGLNTRRSFRNLLVEMWKCQGQNDAQTGRIHHNESNRRNANALRQTLNEVWVYAVV